MKKLSTIVLLLLLSFLGFAQGDQTDITVPYTVSGNSVWHALLHLPNDYANTSSTYPILIFCHGAGEASNPYNLSKLYTFQGGSAGPAYFIAQNQFPQSFTNPVDGAQYKFIVVSPQRSGWGIYAQELQYIIPYLVSHYRIDVSRIYLTGLSAGGEGVVGYASHFDIETGATVVPPYKAAAIVPMSAAIGTPLAGWGTNTAGTDSIHVWGFGDIPGDIHGENTKKYVDFVNAAIAGYGIFTSMTTGHSGWITFYNPTHRENVGGTMMSIYEWLLQYKRGVAGGGGVPAPIANAGSDQTIVLPTSSVTLTGQGLPATNHTIIRYAWTQVSGPNTANIASPTISTSVVNGLIQGAYVIRLTVTDDLNQTGFDDIQITVASAAGPNVGPTVTIRADTTINFPTTSVTLWATATDPEGKPFKRLFWSKLKVPGAAKAAIVHQGSSTTQGAAASDTAHRFATLAGDFYILHGAVDSNYNLGKGGTNIYQGVGTNYPNTFPAGPERPSPVDSINVTKALSYKPKAHVLNYPSNEYDHMRTDQIMWAEREVATEDQTDGVSFFTTGTQPRSQYDQATQNKLKITNDSIANAFGTHFMDLWTPFVVPGTTLYQSQYDGNDGVHGNNNFHAQAAKIEEATNILQDYAVSSSVITSAGSLSTTVTNLGPGVHKFMFSAFDTFGLADCKIVTITVVGSGNSNPTSNAGIDQTIQLAKDSVTVNGSNSVDPDGTITTYSWSKISGPGSFNIISPSSVSTKIKSLVQGVYTFRLTVTDNLGAVGTDDIVVTVVAAPTPPACGRLWRFGPNDTYTAVDETNGDTLINKLPVLYLNGAGFQPGDTIMVDGNYTYANISFVNFHGSASCPIVFRPDTTVPWATLMRVGIAVSNSTFFHLDGKHPSQAFGFHVYDTLPNRHMFNVGLSLNGKDSAGEADHVDIRHTQYGVSMKNTPQCDTSVNYPNWWFGHMAIHDLKIRNVSSEGMYLLSTDYKSQQVGVQCEDGLPMHFYLPTRARFITIYNVDIDSCGRGGIQLSAASEGNNEIYNNKIRNAGEQGDEDQGPGIIIGGITHAYIHNNDIKNTLTWGIVSTGGTGLIRIEDNIIDSSGYLPGFAKKNYGWNINLSTRATSPTDSTTFIVKNNTLGVTAHFPDPYYPDTVHIEIGDEFGTMSRIGNQICGNKFSGGALIPSSRIFVDPSIQVSYNNCGGVNISPTVIGNAQPYKTIFLPLDSVHLVATATDPDGTINNVSWTRLYGPYTYDIKSPTNVDTWIRHLKAGAYVFRVDVVDDRGATATDIVSVIVLNSNKIRLGGSKKLLKGN